jgi:signal transduction histidine kinase
MSGEFRGPDADLPSSSPALGDLLQALDSLRARVTRLEGIASSPALPGREAGARAPGGDPDTSGIVQEILSIPSAGLDPDALFTLAMDRASRLLAADRAMLFVVQPGGTRLVPRSAHGFRREDLESISVLPGEGIVGRVYKERRVLAYTAAGDGEEPDPFIERFPVREALGVPVRAEDDVAGVLYVGRRRLGAPFGTNDVLLLLVVADRVGGGLVHQALLDRRARHIARLGELRAFGLRLLAAHSLDEVLAESCERARRLLEVRAAAVGVLAPSGGIELRATRGLPAAADALRWISPRNELSAEVYAGAEFVACRDVQARPGPDPSFLGEGGFHAALLIPLRAKGSIAGVLYFADTEARDFSTEEIAAARVLGAMVGSAIDARGVTEELEHALGAALSGHERIVRTEKARVLGRMAGGLAHELNNIFAIILGKSRLLLARAHEETLREGLEMLEEAAWRGADVVQRLTALSAPAGETSERLDVRALVEDVIAQTAPRWKDEALARGGPIELSTDLEGAPLIEGNGPALREALANLVLNAVDAMPRGGRLGVAARARDGGVQITVEDTGDGIPEDAQGRVFDPFFTTRLAERMGLGLTVAQAVVTRHGGRIDISSERGAGTRVVVWLPGAARPAPLPPEDAASAGSRGEAHEGREEVRGVAHADRRPAPEIAGTTTPVGEEKPGGVPQGLPQSALRDGPAGGEAATILVLEDEDPVRALLVEALTQAGHKVETAADGSSGLSKLEAGHFDVVLTDLALPQRSGLAVARAVKRRSPGTPVVLITGWGHLLDPERLREHGVDLMLVKPFRVERVVSVVGDALRLRSRS